MSPQSIPQVDLRADYLENKTAIDAAISRVLDSGWYILGKEVTSFEHEFAAYLGVSHCVGVASGTDALVLALRAVGVGRGDRVATVSHTAVATVTAIELCGATPVLVDVDVDTATMDAARLEELLKRYDATGSPIRAVIPVHLYGHPADMREIVPLASRFGAVVVEDCAQAHGASIKGRTVGTWGSVATFSFYPTKNLGAIGDGGAVVTNDPEVDTRLRSLRQYGWQTRYVSDEQGYNSRLDELQAAILRAKLAALESATERRRALAANYDRYLAGSGLGLPVQLAGARHVYHLYVIRSDRRDGLQAHLRQAGVGTLVHYPVPVHLQPAYRDRLDGSDALPVTEALARQVLSLPLYPQLPMADTGRVAEAILTYLRTA